MPSLDQFAQEQLAKMAAKQQQRQLHGTVREAGVHVIRGGRTLISFSCNDYLGLSQHPEVVNAAKAALDEYGIGARASRLVTGNHLLYSALEAQLAKMKGAEAALVFGSGYLTNLGVVPALVGKNDLIIADKLVHACLIDGAQLSGANFKRFRHNDMAHLKQLLETYRGEYRHCLILTDTVFSMDGDLAPLDELESLAEAHDAWLLSDDAHGLGIIEKRDNISSNHIQMGTLSKAVGGYGGYVCASQTVVDYLITAARSLIFSTALPPMVVAASLAALTVMDDSYDMRRNIPLSLARRFALALGLPEPKSTIVPLIVGEEEKALALSAALEEEGFLVSAIRPPTVPAGTARLRFTFSALHDEQDVLKLIACVKKHK